MKAIASCCSGPRLRGAGFSLTEVLVALAILVAIAIPVLVVTRTSYRGAVMSEKRLIGILLAEGLVDELAAEPFPSVSPRAAGPVSGSAPYDALLSAAATRTPTMAAMLDKALAPVQWESGVSAAGELKRLAVEVRWQEGAETHRFSLTGVNARR